MKWEGTGSCWLEGQFGEGEESGIFGLCFLCGILGFEKDVLMLFFKCGGPLVE